MPQVSTTLLVSGTATANTDYVSTSGTLRWTDEDSAEQVITVEITNDRTDESQEAFTVALSNPSPGTTLGSNSTATIVIRDDDVPALGFAESAVGTPEDNGSIVLTVVLVDPAHRPAR